MWPKLVFSWLCAKLYFILRNSAWFCHTVTILSAHAVFFRPTKFFGKSSKTEEISSNRLQIFEISTQWSSGAGAYDLSSPQRLHFEAVLLKILLKITGGIDVLVRVLWFSKTKCWKTTPSSDLVDENRNQKTFAEKSGPPAFPNGGRGLIVVLSEFFSECSRMWKVKKKAICWKLFHIALLCLPRKSPNLNACQDFVNYRAFYE